MNKVLMAIVCVLGFSTIQAKEIDSFEEAKRLLPEVFKGQETTFYCGCKYAKLGKRFVVDPLCKTYTPKKPYTKNGKKNERTHRIEWEHIVPAENFGRQFTCWRDGDEECVDSKGKKFKGRQCCKKVSPEFRLMEGDIRNIVPAIGEINGDRSNFRFAQQGKNESLKGQYGECEFKISGKKAYPRDEIKGWIARTYLYMHEKHNIKISDSELKLMEAWDKQYPAKEEELKWLEKVEKVKKKHKGVKK